MMKVYMIDVDGTALKYPEKVRSLYEDKNNFILLSTSRSESIRKDTVRELRALDVPYHALCMDKPRADVYIDDKNEGGLKWPES